MAKKKKGKKLAPASERAMQRVVEKDRADAEAQANRFYAPGSLPRYSTPDSIASLAAPGQVSTVNTDISGLTSTAAQAQKAHDESLVRDQYITDALTRMQAGLEGISAQENQALREAGAREVRANTASALRQLRGYQGARGITGNSAGSVARGLLQNQQNVLGNMETDLIVNNVQEKARRLGEYGNYANSAYLSYNQARDSAMARLLQSNESVNNAQLARARANQEAQQQNITNAYNFGQTNADIQAKNIAAQRETEAQNIQQQEKELSGRLGIYYGEQSATAARRNQAQQNRLAKRYARLASAGV